MSCAQLRVIFERCRQLVCPLLEAQVQPQEVAHHDSVQAAGVNAPSAVGDQMGRYLAREARGTPVAQAHGYGSVPIRCQIRNKYEK